jgi:hypothetical protein
MTSDQGTDARNISMKTLMRLKEMHGSGLRGFALTS